MDKQPIPETMLEAVRQFSDPDKAHDFFVQLRWPNGVACPRQGCGSADVAYLARQKRWYCRECKRQSSAKVGTIFEDSPIGFDKWLPAIWLIASNRNGISSCELARALKVTQKSAWFMLHRIRLAMKDDAFDMLSGEVEADETYIGGSVTSKRHKRLAQGRKPQGPQKDKVAVMGMVERGGRVRAFTIPSNRKETLLPAIVENVAAGSTVYTDSLGSYTDLRKGYAHFVINHAERYVNGRVHTNSIENFWSVLKRTLGGTYIAARPQHLDAYLDEQIFRFNERREKDGPRFAKVTKAMDGRRLTWKTLTRKA
jgi:transposase-like protein